MFIVEIYRWHLFYLGTWGRKVKELCRNLNELHPAIKFTADWSQKSINFLDVTLSLIDSQIETDLYVKPTDSYQYLHFFSCHLCYCKKNIPHITFRQALRLNRICSKNDLWFDIHCNNLEKWLSKRDYSENLVLKVILKARS